MVEKNIRGTTMRSFLVLTFSLAAASLAAASLGAVGAAHAQLQPISPPKNPYALPQSSAPASSGFTPYKPHAYENPAVQPSAADPYPHMRHTPGVTSPPAATAADPYPSLRRKHRASENHF
jgi:hypothetical protein